MAVVIDIRNGDEELLTAEARQRSPVRIRPQTLGEASQHLVPRGMARAVVDALEMIEVQHHHRDALAGPAIICCSR
jgi:hypothetical protein